MYSFRNDYSEGAHPEILKALIKYNDTQEEGYGLDSHSKNAKQMIQSLIGNSTADIHLISGGTQTNLLAISAFLRPHEACISPESGHIATYETGAIEATGHKIITVKTEDGKLNETLINDAYLMHHFEHMVKPKLVYISNPTEMGTVYSRAELEALYVYCKKNNLILYCDGARLGMALSASDITLEDMYANTDAFFIGGTKVGALLGEALVIKNNDLKEDFRYLTKQRGALLAKGRVLGIQFETLFKEGLYFELSEHANKMAQKLAHALKAEGCSLWMDSPTNQIFPILPNDIIEKLMKFYDFYTWQPIDTSHSAIRLITSWATKVGDVDGFIKQYKTIKG